jgi:hypothetical protein
VYKGGIIVSINCSLTGDWKRAGTVLRNLATQITPIAEAKLYENGELLLEKLVGHIDAQDLAWVPKKDGGQVYVDTGELRGSLTVRRVKSSVKGSTIFVGASPWMTHKGSGLKFSDLMIYLEYGTRRIPARPLIRPTWEEMQDIVKDHMKEIGQEVIDMG